MTVEIFENYVAVETEAGEIVYINIAPVMPEADGDEEAEPEW